MKWKSRTSLVLIFLLLFSFVHISFAKGEEPDLKERTALYMKTQAVTLVPWYYIAAVDQYEKNIRKSRRDLPKPKGLSGVYFSKRDWVGALNPDYNDTNALRISLFNGIGLDGNGDNKADMNDPEDALYTAATQIAAYGPDEDSIRMGLWNYYHRSKAVKIITELAKMYRTFGTIDLDAHDFPIPFRYNYTYHSTWGAKRGWGGLRIHEGTDIFANYGTPVKATSYGVVELIGWNKFGGWRIGIRDPHNIYHYFAHLRGYAKGMAKGTVVKPGQVIGYVGSSGYGPKGTQGKFPPHLHYGMYKYNGVTEFSFDPYPSLRIWERRAKQKSKH